MSFPSAVANGPLCTANFNYLEGLITFGRGNPEGAVRGRIGALYLREDGEPGKTFYVKEEGDGTDEGWAVLEGSKGGGFATIAELVKEAELRAAGDSTLSGLISTEKAERELAEEDFVEGPATATDGDIAVYDGATGKKIKDGSKTIAQVLARENHTGNQLASTISNFDTQVRTSRLDQMATPTANVSWGEKKITKLADPTENLDAANKEYVDAAASAAAAGLSVKNPVSYATTAVLNLVEAEPLYMVGNCPLTVDGKSGPAVGTRILVKNQTSEFRNGIYEVTKEECFAGEGTFGGSGEFAVGSQWRMDRTSDADTETEVKQGMFVLVTLGTTNANTTWILTTENPIVIGTTNQKFAAFTAQPIGSAGGDLTGTYPNPQIGSGVIVNADVNSSAAIAYSKLNLATSIVNADVSGSAAVAYSKLNLASSITGTGDMAAGVRNYGVVEALPSSPSPAKGDICYYKVAAGFYWTLVYTGEETYPWAKVGGPALADKTTTEKSTASASYVTLESSPSITTPGIKLEATVYQGARLVVTGGPSFAFQTLFTSGGSEVAGTANEWNSSAPHGGSPFESIALAASTTYTFRYKTSAGTSFWNNRYLVIEPNRVG